MINLTTRVRSASGAPSASLVDIPALFPERIALLKPSTTTFMGASVATLFATPVGQKLQNCFEHAGLYVGGAIAENIGLSAAMFFALMNLRTVYEASSRFLRGESRQLGFRALWNRAKQTYEDSRLGGSGIFLGAMKAVGEFYLKPLDDDQFANLKSSSKPDKNVIDLSRIRKVFPKSFGPLIMTLGFGMAVKESIAHGLAVHAGEQHAQLLMERSIGLSVGILGLMVAFKGLDVFIERYSEALDDILARNDDLDDSVSRKILMTASLIQMLATLGCIVDDIPGLIGFVLGVGRP